MNQSEVCMKKPIKKSKLVRDYTNMMSKLKNKRNDLEYAHSKVLTQSDDIKTKLEQSSAFISDHEDKIKDHQDNIDDLNRLYEQAGMDIESHQGNIIEHENRSNILRNNCSALKGEIESHYDEYNQHLREVESHKAMLKTFNEKMAMVQEHTDKYNDAKYQHESNYGSVRDVFYK